MKGENDFAPKLRDAFTRGLGKNALTRADTWLRSGGGGVAFGDGNSLEPLA
jgi:hypothetical protein